LTYSGQQKKAADVRLSVYKDITEIVLNEEQYQKSDIFQALKMVIQNPVNMSLV
jgi:hypothetical protein